MNTIWQNSWPKTSVIYCIAFVTLVTRVSGQTIDKGTDVFSLTISTNPLLFAHGPRPNIQLIAGRSWFTVGVSAYYSAYTRKIKSFTNQHTDFLLASFIRVYPFNSFFNRLQRTIVAKTTQASCFSFRQTGDDYNTPNGFYMSAGYAINRLNFNYVPDSSLHSPINNFPMSVKNNGFQVEAGYQFTYHWLSVGLGYNLFFTIPVSSGQYNAFGDDFYSNTYPFKYRIAQHFQLQVGINFSFKNKSSW